MMFDVLLSILFLGFVIGAVKNDYTPDPDPIPTESTIPEWTTRDTTTPEENTPSQTTSDPTEPDENTPAQTTSDPTEPDENTPAQTTSDPTEPDENTPAQTTSDPTEPDETTPAPATPEPTTPEPTTPEPTTPEPTTPEPTTPEPTTPAPTTPELTTPEPTTPEPTTPAPTTPEPTTPEPTSPEQFELPLAEECDEELCKLPDCRCSSTENPGGLSTKDTPQFVTITFDDGVNVINIETYRNVLYNRSNSNGCPAGVTFYVSHEYTNYVLVNELYNRGFEIALHSISHRTPQGYWATADYDVIKEEIADQRILVSHFANIPFETIQGVRLPFLQMTGNASFHVMADYGLDYDCSWPTTAYTNPGLWPYSLDYASKQDCIVPPCPTASIPKTWVQPMVSWTDLNGFPCSMADSCFFTPGLDDEEGWYQFIVNNFKRHYEGNRAPFGYYIHEWYLAANPAVRAAFIRFMDLVSSLDDAFMVTSSEVLDWVKNPIPVDEYRSKGCRQWRPMPCAVQSCGPLLSEHNQLSYWVQLCNICPRSYPWTGNPLGV